ncbi:zinc finger protein 595-like [Maniola hyperantus]|uniref:zinc finger protein 595-like n=1 Tax=Aphantopus hyperantus TaxID=2795564 RepID=UPI001569F068|nr:zinc finger protein 569-like [Maniola hyperantus]
MFDLKVCTVCLQMDVRCYNLNENSGQLRKDYNVIAGLETRCGNGLPEYLCYQCAAQVQKCKSFHERCQRAYFVLQEVLQKNKEITKSIIEEIDVNMLNIGPTLSFLNKDSVKSKFDKVKFKWIKTIRMSIDPQEKIPVIQYGPQYDESFEQVTQAVTEASIKNENVCQDLNNEDYNAELDATENDNFFNEDFQCENEKDFDVDIDIDTNEIEPKIDRDADGSQLNEEYAIMVPISLNEASAVVEISKLDAKGKYPCDVCERMYSNATRLKVHKRMHEKHISGTHRCVICNYYYKTQFLLKTHMTDKHMYKYLCRKCPQVSFDRPTAKRHFMWTHIQKKKSDTELKCRPKWLRTRGKRNKTFPKKPTKIPKDFLTYTPISQEEQYRLVSERQNSRNYVESLYRCEYCFKGFREDGTYTKHMQKHDPAISGSLQCDMCKIYCVNARKMYKHMNLTHLFKYTCVPCNFVCYNKGQASNHYKWHQNVTYPCPHCDKVFYKLSTRLTHIRIKHPSMYICNLCGHSFVSENGLYCHKKMAHSQQEVEDDTGAVDTSDPLYCSECRIQFRDDAAFATHFGSSNKHADTNLSIKPVRTRIRKSRGRPRRDNTDIVNNGLPTATNCEICQKFLASDVAATRHYEAEHPGADYLKRYMCDICGHTTKQYANLMVHMRTHTREKPYACPHCERRFSMPSNRDRHLVVHTGEKRYQCQHCNRRFTQSSAVKLHIQTVHLKIPYAPWDKKNRKRRRDNEVPPSPPPARPNTTTRRIVIDADNYLSAYITYNE